MTDEESNETEELPPLRGGVRALDIPGLKKGIPKRSSSDQDSN